MIRAATAIALASIIAVLAGMDSAEVRAAWRANATTQYQGCNDK